MLRSYLGNIKTSLRVPHFLRAEAIPLILYRSLLLVLSLLFTIISSCGIYSFSGASLSPDVKTFTVRLFSNQASIVVPTLSQTFTDALRDKINNQTNLTLLDREGDIEFNGVITDYSISFMAPTGNETAALNRLTISVRVDFENKKNPKENWSNSFFRFADYASTINLSSVENQLITEINQQLVQDIFNKAIVNW